MSKNQSTGKVGEQVALGFLEANNFCIINTNWRHSYFEIDIVATKNNLLHIIEVKTRTSRTFGYPEESVSYHKFRNLQSAAEQYMLQHPQWTRVQFDILSVNYAASGIQCYLIEDVFF